MTDLEMRIAIAEACGYVDVKLTPHPMAYLHHSPFTQVEKVLTGIVPNKLYVYPIPNYLSDLNAMHIAEQIVFIDEAAYSDFLRTLRNMATTFGPNGSAISVDERQVVSASAQQRAEAVVKTIGKWTPFPKVG